MSENESGTTPARAGAFQPGADPRRGRGPKKGEGGRPPDEFKQQMRELLDDRAQLAYLRKCLRGEFGPRFFLQARAEVADRAYGRPTQSLKHEGEVDAPLVIRLVDETKGQR